MDQLCNTAGFLKIKAHFYHTCEQLSHKNALLQGCPISQQPHAWSALPHASLSCGLHQIPPDPKALVFQAVGHAAPTPVLEIGSKKRRKKGEPREPSGSSRQRKAKGQMQPADCILTTLGLLQVRLKSSHEDKQRFINNRISLTFEEVNEVQILTYIYFLCRCNNFLVAYV